MRCDDLTKGSLCGIAECHHITRYCKSKETTGHAKLCAGASCPSIQLLYQEGPCFRTTWGNRPMEQATLCEKNSSGMKQQ